MSQNLNARILSEGEYAVWDRFVQSSPQGSLFSSLLWLRMFGEPFKIFVCNKGDEIVGGIAVIEDPKGENTSALVHFTPYQGILLRDNARMKKSDRISIEKNIAISLIELLERTYHGISIFNHWEFQDARPFYWHCYGRAGDEYVVTLRYTSVVDISDETKVFENMDEDTKYEIRKAEKNSVTIIRNDNFHAFDRLHDATFKRQGIERSSHETELIKKIYDTLRADNRARIYFARDKDCVDTAGAVIIWDNKRAYYMFGATDPRTRNNGGTSLLLYRVFSELSKNGFKEIDLVGVNSPKRGRFKIGFGGDLKSYILIERKFKHQ